MNTIEKDLAYVVPSYKRYPICLVRGEGSLLFDENEKRYIDMGTGIGVNIFGIADEKWTAAVKEQLGLLQHACNLYYTKPCAELAKLLSEKSGMSKVFFANSGAEANENGIKAIRKYAAEKKGEEYYTIITLEQSFHGRTLTTLAATGQDHFHQLFRPLTPGFVSVPPDDIGALKKAAGDSKAAGVMIECVQGEGGVRALDASYVRELAEFCRDEDLVLLCDEVQCGNGRTGEMYAYMHYGIEPDVVTTAKGLGGGLPIGACMLGEKLVNIFSYGDAGSTFGGNPIVCAGAVSIVERLDEAMLSEVREKSDFIFGALSGAKGIKSVSGLGLMIGIETEKDAAELVSMLIDEGVLALTAAGRIRLLPALNIPMELLTEAVERIKAVCA